MNTGSLPGMIVSDSRSYKANGAITKFAALCISNSTTGDVALPASANDEDCVGFARYAVVDNDTVEVVVAGSMEVVAAAAITQGAWCVVADTAGKVKTDPKTSTSTSHVVGRALTPASAPGDHIILEIIFFDRYNA